MNSWPLDQLKRWPEPALRDVAIPESSKHFLLEVGLPCNEDWTLRFDPAADQFPRKENRSNYRRIGFDYCVPIYLDEQRGGCVLADESEIGGSERFINSRVELFGEFLGIYQEYRKTVASLSEEADVLTFIAVIEARMRSIDPSAFDSSDSYWPVVIEQMNQGML